jgi:hypothetical protein
LYNSGFLAFIYVEHGSISSPVFSINRKRASLFTFSILRRNKEFLTAIIFLLRYLVLGTMLREKGDSVTTYVTEQIIVLRLGSRKLYREAISLTSEL